MDKLAIAVLPRTLWNSSIQLPAAGARHARPPPAARRQQSRAEQSRALALSSRPRLRRAHRQPAEPAEPSPMAMSGGFQAYGHAPGHYHESALAFGAPHLPFRPPELASARYQHPHADHFHYTQTASMSDAPFLTPEDEFAQLQKLSNEYEPEVTVSSAPTPPVGLR